MTATAPRAPRTRRALRAFSSVLIVAGTILLADAGATFFWQEPVSAVYATSSRGSCATSSSSSSRRRSSRPRSARWRRSRIPSGGWRSMRG